MISSLTISQKEKKAKQFSLMGNVKLKRMELRVSAEEPTRQRIKGSAAFPAQRGQSTLEVVIALTLLTLGLTSAVLVIVSGQSLAVDSEESNVALRLAQQNLETAAASVKDNFTTLAYSSSTQNEFLKEVVIATTTDPNTLQVTSRVTWSTDPLRNQKVELTTLVTNWWNSQNNGGNTGGGGTSGDWCNPRTFGSINLGAGEQATGVDVISTIAYMTATASSPSKPDFFTIDVSNSSNPTILASIDTGPGLNALAATTNYAYVANNKTSQQLQIIDISNGSSPKLVTSFTLPGSSGRGRSIFYYSKKVYMGTDADATGPEFHIIDVSSSTNPVDLGSYKIGFDVNKIFVNGSYAYLATADTSNDLQIFDVSNPASIVRVGTYDVPDGEVTKSLFLVGTKLYLGRAQGDKEFYILDVTNASSVQVLGSKQIGSDVNDLEVRGKYAFLATSDVTNEMKIYNIFDPTNITTCSNFNFPNIAVAVDFNNNLVYTAVRSNDGLRIITSQ